MPGTLTTYKIFVASAGGLDEFRKDFRKIIEHYNTTEAYHRGYMFMPVGWEDTTTGHGRPQAKINEDLRQCDFALFMFRNRWGTPPDTGSTYTSGTEEEWAIANEMHAKRTMRDIQGCFFPFKPCDTQEEMDHRSKVEAFKKKLIDEKQFFFKSFSADSEFQDWFRSITSGWLRDIEKETSSLAESKKQFIAREKSQTQTAPTNSKSAFNLLRKQLFKLFDTSQYLAAQGVVQALHQVAEKPLEIAQALHFEGFIQSQLGQFQEALHLASEVVRRFGDTSNPALRAQVAKALVNKGVAHGQLNQIDTEIATYDEVVHRFGEATESALCEQVAKALVSKGITQGQLTQFETAIATYDDVVRRFGDATEPALCEQVAKALVNKGVAHGQLNQIDAEIATYDEVVHRFGAATEPTLCEQVAKALVNKGIVQGEIDQIEAAISTFDEVVRRFGDATEPTLCEQVNNALNGSGFSRLLQAKRVGPQTPRGQDKLRTALESLSNAIARSAQPNGMFLGNRAYVHHLLGQAAPAEADFAAALRAPEYGGRSIYDATIEDLVMHPIPEDEGMRALVERAWADYQQETGGNATAA